MKVRAAEFRRYDRKLDPSTLAFHVPRAFKTITAAYKRRALTEITSATPPPANPSMARKYPDRDQWAAAHDKELDQLDYQKVATWCYHNKELPKGSIVIPLTVHYRYKRNQVGDITAYKARCAAIGDKMVKYQHYDPEEVSTHTTDKTTMRFLLSLAANKHVNLQNYDITSAFTHERIKSKNPIFIRQEPRFYGSLKHEHEYGRLDLNLYGSVMASYIYLEGLAKHFLKHGYTRSDHDP